MLASCYGTLLAIHCDLRWLVLFSGVAASVTAIIGLTRRLPFAPSGRVAGLIYVSSLDTQVLGGILLSFPSPYVKEFLADPAAAMKLHDLRFFAVEHTMTMILALVLAHVGAVRSRKLAPISQSAYGAALKWYAVSLLVLLSGIPWWRPLLQP